MSKFSFFKCSDGVSIRLECTATAGFSITTSERSSDGLAGAEEADEALTLILNQKQLNGQS